MNEQIIRELADSLKIRVNQVENTLNLLQQDNTVPFIARYRKEATGGLDEQQILAISKQYEYEVKLAERKEAVLNRIATQGKLTDEIRDSINAATKLSEVEDLYRPYIQKKKTKAAMAIKKGLQPLADWMLSLPKEGDLKKEAEKYLNDEVADVKEAIQGAEDIIAETVSDTAKLRWSFRDFIYNTGKIVTKVKKNAEDEKKVYEMYYDRSERVNAIADHRVMAIDRAEKEKVLTVSFEYDDKALIEEAFDSLVGPVKSVINDEIHFACEDGCKRLLFPSVEREVRSQIGRAHV